MLRNLVGFPSMPSLQFSCRFHDPFLLPDISTQICFKASMCFKDDSCPLPSWSLLYSSASAPYLTVLTLLTFSMWWLSPWLYSRYLYTRHIFVSLITELSWQWQLLPIITPVSSESEKKLSSLTSYSNISKIVISLGAKLSPILPS